jgi:ribonuclease VapC
MYVDASAIVAVLIGEADGSQLLARIEESRSPFTSIVTKVEAALAIGRAMGDVKTGADLVDAFLDQLDVRVDAVPVDLYESIMQAAARYGKGTGHPARLNFGDCFSYAMAKRAGVPLLYKGNDFSKTDLA